MTITTPFGRAFAAVLIALVCSISVARAQTTAFSYQGQLNDGATAANGTYNMRFTLFDAAANGNQIGAPITNTTVTVLNGVFTVQLDFTTTPFAAGATRYLQIEVKKPSDAVYTALTPRQPMTSSPYSIRTISAGASDALSAACVGCVTNAQIGAVDGSKISGTVANATTATTATSAGNVTGTVAVANGGTGATSAANARTNLGLGTLATASPTGTANSTTYLRGDNTYAAIPSTGSSIGTILAGRTSSNSSATSPLYLNIVGLGSAVLNTSTVLPTAAEVVMPINGTVDTFFIQTGGTASPTIPVTYTIYKNNTATALTCTINVGANQCSSGGALGVVPGDRLLIRVDFTGNLPSLTAFAILSSIHIK